MRTKYYLHRLTLPALLLPLFGTTSLVKAQEPADTNYAEAMVPAYSLPPLFPEGTPLTTDADKRAARTLWETTRRSEVLSMLETHVYGKTPSAEVDVRSKLLESNDNALDGKAIRRQIALTISPRSHPERSIEIEMLIYAPKQSAKGAGVPAFMGLNFYGNQTVHADPAVRISEKWMRGNGAIGIVNNRATKKTRGAYTDRWQVEMLVARGYGLVTAYCGDIDPDNYSHDFTDGVHPLFYKAGQTQPADDEWGAIGAWARGLSWMRSWLETQAVAETLIDAEKIAVIGHSRLGKTALWAGATDQKFALVISNNSGCGGAALYRRCYGERIHHMLKPVGYWFCRNHARYAQRESELPVDQHMLLALVAPRPLYVASAAQDRWADPKGEYLSAWHASPIYALFGKQGLPTDEMPEENEPVGRDVGYHLRSGKHDVTTFDWEQYLAFADRHLSSN